MLKSFAIFSICLMLTALGYGFIYGELSEESNILMSLPWGRVTIIDFYTGIAIFSSWVMFREQNALISLIWVIAFIFTGNLATAIYLLKAIIEADGDHQKLLFGLKRS